MDILSTKRRIYYGINMIHKIYFGTKVIWRG